jgi:hypothetical protein
MPRKQQLVSALCIAVATPTWGMCNMGVANFALAKLPAETLPFLVIGLHASLASRSAPNVREIDLLDYLMGETFQQQC